MGHNRGRKAYVGVLALAGAALAGDKLLFGVTGPDSAIASSDYAIDPAQWTEDAREPSDSAEPLLSGAAERMELLGRAHGECVDAFAQPKSWLEQAVKTPASPGTPDVTDPGEGFEKRAKLTGLSVSGDTLLAIVNGKRIAVGEPVEGFVLTSVDLRLREAVFRSADGHERTLRVAGATSGNRVTKR